MALRILSLLIVLLCVQPLHAQEGFRLKRTKRVSTPISIQIFGGYNGMSDPSEALQDMFENTNRTSWGGLMLGAQAAIEIDTVFGFSFWGGVEGYYHRLATRWLADKPDVGFPDSDELVQHTETLSAFGGNIFLAYGPLWIFTLQVGGGLQYLSGHVDTSIPINGLFQSQVVPVFLGAVNVRLLSYDHGSIDAIFRSFRGFGDYGSYQQQSLIGFTFLF